MKKLLLLIIIICAVLIAVQLPNVSFLTSIAAEENASTLPVKDNYVVMEVAKGHEDGSAFADTASASNMSVESILGDSTSILASNESEAAIEDYDYKGILNDDSFSAYDNYVPESDELTDSVIENLNIAKVNIQSDTVASPEVSLPDPNPITEAVADEKVNLDAAINNDNTKIAPVQIISVENITASNSYGFSALGGNNLLPSISYPDANNFIIGAKIKPLVPENGGSSVPAAVYGQVTTIAGSGYSKTASLNSLAPAANFYYPYSTAVDGKGNIYVADQGNSLIRKITPAGVVSTLAGSGHSGFKDGFGASASFSNPKGVAVDAAGNVYVADAVNNRIRKISPLGMVTTLAGNGISALADGTSEMASFYNPSGIAVDKQGNVYVADEYNNAIRKISPLGEVTTLAGNGKSGSADGIGDKASFNYPAAVATDLLGNIYVADHSNHKIRKVTADGSVSTLAGTGLIGSLNGLGTSASFYDPSGIAVDNAGIIYVADAGNHQIRKITPNGEVSSVVCSDVERPTKEMPANSSFYNPSGITSNGQGAVFVADQNNNRIRKVGLTGYTISPALPAGLRFDSATGIISGTPTAVSDLTEYVITAYNVNGSSSARVSFSTIIPEAPYISYFTPVSGPGKTITIIGTNLLNVTKVTIGGTPALSFAAISANSITAIVPSGALSGNITVTNPHGTSTVKGFILEQKSAENSQTASQSANRLVNNK